MQTCVEYLFDAICILRIGLVYWYIVTVLMFVMKASVAKFLDVLQFHLLLCIPCMYFIVIFLQLWIHK